MTILLITAVSGLVPLAGASDRWETLKAINWVENPTNHTRFGSKGELGPYQFRSQTWKLHTDLPFSYATSREHADAIAVKHYEWIRRGLQAKGIDANPYNIALAWNSGLGAVTKGRVPSSTYRYAEQVQNLVEMLKQQQRLARPTQVAAAKTVAPVKPIPAPVLTLDADAVHFSRVTTNAPAFVLDAAPAALAEAEEVLPVVVTDKTPVPAPVARQADQSFFVATTLGAPRFLLLD